MPCLAHEGQSLSRSGLPAGRRVGGAGGLSALAGIVGVLALLRLYGGWAPTGPVGPPIELEGSADPPGPAQPLKT